jgi:YbbR domain-containing protein
LADEIEMSSLSQRFRLAEVWRRTRRNPGLKIISVLIALGLWMFVNAGQRGAVEALQVPISYRSLPTGLVIINRPTDFVKIEVAGPRTLLSLLDPERLTLKLDLTGVPTGRSDFKINSAMFNVPRQTSVTRITPAEVQIFVSGPSRYVMPLTEADTDPLDIKGASADLQRIVGLTSPNHDVHLSAEKVTAAVDIGEIIANREFKGVAVQVRDTDHKYRLDPAKATITLRGPVLKLSSLDPTGIVYVDAKDGTPGSHDMAVQVDLPDGMELVKQEPEKVRIRIYREKRPATTDGKTS